MPGPAFHFEVLDQTIINLGSDDRGKLMEKYKSYARLGALGPDLLRYIPAGQELLDKFVTQGPNLIQTIIDTRNEKEFLGPTEIEIFGEFRQHSLMFVYGYLFRKVVLPYWPLRQKLLDFLTEADQTAIEGSESEQAVAALKPKFDALPSELDFMYKAGKDLTQLAGLAAMTAPAIQNDSDIAGEYKPWQPQGARAFEFLRWHRTGRFARRLVELADDPSVHGNNAETHDKLKAYAYGYLCHTAASVTGEPLINNIVGGPYRTHWWRNRLVSNHVDVWTYGRYRTQGAKVVDDVPYPQPAGYAGWSPLCSAGLHEKIRLGNLPLPGLDAAGKAAEGLWADLSDDRFFFPPELGQMLARAVQETHTGLGTPPELNDPDLYKQAYVGAYAVLWLMTGGEGPLCLAEWSIAPPCSAPDWVSEGGAPGRPGKEHFLEEGGERDC